MNDFNKISLTKGSIVFAIAVVIFFSIITVVTFCPGNANWFAIIVPLIAAAYGCYSLVKKYWPDDKY